MPENSRFKIKKKKKRKPKQEKKIILKGKESKLFSTETIDEREKVSWEEEKNNIKEWENFSSRWKEDEKQKMSIERASVVFPSMAKIYKPYRKMLLLSTHSHTHINKNYKTMKNDSLSESKDKVYWKNLLELNWNWRL